MRILIKHESYIIRYNKKSTNKGQTMKQEKEPIDVKITFTATQTMKDVIVERAEEDDRSASYIIRQAVNKFLTADKKDK